MMKHRISPWGTWLPVATAVGIAAVVSIGAFAPQWGNRIVRTQLEGSTHGGPQGGGPLADNTGPAAINTGGGTYTPGGPQASQTANVPGAQGIDCAHGRNGGNTAPGVSATVINIATTDVTSGVGAGFLQEAAQGMQAAINQSNNAGTICGRRINLQPPQNDGWDAATGQAYIENFINSGSVFALVGEPDSQGLKGAIESGDIDRAKIPVVGTDGMLSDQYQDGWVWPVAASTVTNMHVLVKYAHDQGWAQQAKDFAIVYDTDYNFGPEGAKAFAEEVRRIYGSDLPGYPSSGGCQLQFCGISSKQGDFTTEKNSFNNACEVQNQCKVVILLLEPDPALKWMKDENPDTSWFKHLMGGEPLFDYSFGNQCKSMCANMMVWTGYHPDLQPFDSEKPVYTFAQALKAVCPSCDSQNEFTEGAYLGTQLFINAVKQLATNNEALTRDNLKQLLDTETADLGIASPLHFGTSLPRVANPAMTGYSDNSGGSFNGWNYDQTGFITDPARGQDFAPRTW